MSSKRHKLTIETSLPCGRGTQMGRVASTTTGFGPDSIRYATNFFANLATPSGEMELRCGWENLSDKNRRRVRFQFWWRSWWFFMSHVLTGPLILRLRFRHLPAHNYLWWAQITLQASHQQMNEKWNFRYALLIIQ